jgi:hypothetical protein
MALIHGPIRDLIGQPLGDRTAPEPGLVFVKAGETDMAKAPHSGVYEDANGNRFVIFKGDQLPDGVVMDADPNAEPDVEERAKPKAPSNRALKAAPENRSE